MPVRTIEIPVAALAETRDSTSLVSDAASGSGTLSVKNIIGFAINQILLIGNFGVEDSEVIKTHAATAPTGSTVTLASNTVLAHTAYSSVTILLYDQVEISHSATETGVKTVLATSNIRPDAQIQHYDDSANTSGYYFYRYKNSITSTFGSYSDPIPYDGDNYDTVAYIAQYALERNNTAVSKDITDTFIFKEITSCLRYITGKRKKWSKLQSFDYVLGQTSIGSNSFSLPTDIYDSTSNKSVLSVRLRGGDHLTYIDKKEYDDSLRYTVYTTVRTQALAGDTSFAIVNSYDFPDSGTVSVFVSNVEYTITYTGVTRSSTAGVLTGIPATGDGSITVTVPVSSFVAFQPILGQPDSFTVWDGNLYVLPFPSSTYINNTVILDYWTAPTEVNSYGDVLDTYRADMVQDWLTWAIRAKIENRGKRDLQDADFLIFQEKLRDAIRNERTGQKYKWTPKVSGVDLTRNFRIQRG